MTAFIDEQRGRFGVEPICRTLDVSASAYYHRATGRRSDRVIEDERLLERVREMHAANYYAFYATPSAAPPQQRKDGRAAVLER